jgi:rhamnose utilization protein RhaD (predicted bifunctional aldolase and dehydrogenase)
MAGQRNVVTIHDVAKRARVSYGTVSHVLNHPDRVLLETRLRVQRAISDLGWVPNRAAKELRTACKPQVKGRNDLMATKGTVDQTIASNAALDQLVARSRRLGSDRSVCNWGGGNTSAKAEEVDFRGRPSRVLWVKGSGSDLATVTEASFTGLYLESIMPLLERERMSDTEMVNYLAHCFFDLGRPRPSIETLLHAFLPFSHIDHTHADATNYLACAQDGERLARECFGGGLIWIPYRRPGFGLAREVALALRATSDATLVILAKHGLITWGETDEACYASTIATITQAKEFVEARIACDDQAGHALFGGLATAPLVEAERRDIAAAAAPTLRGTRLECEVADLALRRQ